MIPTSRRIVTLPFFFLGLPVLSVFLEFGMNRPHGLQVYRGYELLAKIREYYTLFLRDDITSCWFTLTGGLPNQPPFPRPPVRPNGCFRGLPPKANS